MGEKAERDNRAKACKRGRANICAHCGTCQPPSWDPPASSRPNSGVCVCPHAQHVCTCVFMHLYTVEHGARRGSHWALPGPNALGGAATGPGHGARRGSAGFRRESDQAPPPPPAPPLPLAPAPAPAAGGAVQCHWRRWCTARGAQARCSRRGQLRMFAALAHSPTGQGPPAAHPPVPGAGGERPPNREEEEAPPRLSSRAGPRSNPASAPPRPPPRRRPPACPPAGGGALPWQPCCARRGHPFPSLPFLRSPPFRPRHAASPPAHQPASAGRHRSLAQGGMGRRPRPAPPRPRDRPARSGPALRAPRWAPGEAPGDAASGGTPALRGEHRLIPMKGPVALLVAPG